MQANAKPAGARRRVITFCMDCSLKRWKSTRTYPSPFKKQTMHRRRDPSRLATRLSKVEKYTEPPTVKLSFHVSSQGFNKMLHGPHAGHVL